MRAPRFLAALLLCLSPLVARAAPYKLTTWNLDWLTLRPQGDTHLPDDVTVRAAADFARLRRYAAFLAPDIVAVQEVDGPAPLARLFPPADYTLLFTRDHVVQRVGLAVRHGIALHQNPDLTALDVYPPEAKYPLRSGLDATLVFPGGATLRVLAVHLKTGCWDRPLTYRSRACRTLRAQLRVIGPWVAAREAEHVAFAVLGDFNRDMDGRDAFLPALDQIAPLRDTTQGYASPCWGGDRFIDHILLGGPARSWLVPHSLRVMVYKETSPALKDALSDHCPVSVRIDPKP